MIVISITIGHSLHPKRQNVLLLESATEGVYKLFINTNAGICIMQVSAGIFWLLDVFVA